MNIRDLQDGIIIAARDTQRLTGSKKGLDISIDDLWFLNPAYSEEDIILALKDMGDIETVDAESGIVHIPEHYLM
ncbi:MAG TPA: hypothetical protein VK772_17820 [Puia sp.]|jgi:hypothetical protein|nr:hypothetical protein [Puia sp.]